MLAFLQGKVEGQAELVAISSTAKLRGNSGGDAFAEVLGVGDGDNSFGVSLGFDEGISVKLEFAAQSTLDVGVDLAASVVDLGTKLNVLVDLVEDATGKSFAVEQTNQLVLGALQAKSNVALGDFAALNIVASLVTEQEVLVCGNGRSNKQGTREQVNVEFGVDSAVLELRVDLDAASSSGRGEGSLNTNCQTFAQVVGALGLDVDEVVCAPLLGQFEAISVEGGGSLKLARDVAGLGRAGADSLQFNAAGGFAFDLNFGLANTEVLGEEVFDGFADIFEDWRSRHDGI